nr:hypothetical protein [Streptomyces piniterrae]
MTTKKCQRVGTWAAANNVEIAYTPTNSSWLNRIEAQFTALRFSGDMPARAPGTDTVNQQPSAEDVSRALR